MAFKMSDSGVTFSRGRGSAKLSLDISFNELDRWARRNAVNTHRLMNRSFGRAASGLRSKLRQTMRVGGGVNGVPKFKDFEEFTSELRTATGKSGPIGGSIARPDNIVSFKRNGWQIIGWRDSWARLVDSFQDGAGGSDPDAPFTSYRSRAYFHKLGIKDVPMSYVHNPRQILNEFGEYVKLHLKEWARGAFYKELARQMTKGTK